MRMPTRGIARMLILILMHTVCGNTSRGSEYFKLADFRLVEKFAVLGREDIAEPLERMLPYINSETANIETLTLLVALSDKPVDRDEFDESKFIVEKPVQKEITWEEIIAEEPLVGEHWIEPQYSESEEDEWEYDLKSVDAKVEVVEVKEKPTVRETVEVDNIGEELLRGQYWLRRKFVVRSNDDSEYGTTPKLQTNQTHMTTHENTTTSSISSPNSMQSAKSSSCSQAGTVSSLPSQTPPSQSPPLQLN